MKGSKNQGSGKKTHDLHADLETLRGQGIAGPLTQFISLEGIHVPPCVTLEGGKPRCWHSILQPSLSVITHLEKVTTGSIIHGSGSQLWT